MQLENSTVLTINGGSSSIKIGVYEMAGNMVCTLSGKITRIGTGSPDFIVTYNRSLETNSIPFKAANFKEAAGFLADWLERQPGFAQITCIGHRVVHGLKHTHAEIIRDRLLAELTGITAYDPDHLPAEIEMVQTFKARHPGLMQVACFDTAFHTTMPRVAKILPIPRRFDAAGIQRYGFHGLSYTYLMQSLTAAVGDVAANGRVILAHLGSGASLAAVKNGQSVDTTMGFTPVGGMVMGTRTGDIDPGVAWYMMQSEAMTPEQFNSIINHESGLLGVSGLSADMQDLLSAEKTDVQAAEAVELFCYSAKKWIGAFTAVLGGVDILVFSGGVGENAPIIRKRICEGLGYLGITIDEGKNDLNAPIISSTDGIVKVMVIPTDEELMLAKSATAIYAVAKP